MPLKDDITWKERDWAHICLFKEYLLFRENFTAHLIKA
jgi:hypothetical protein